MAFTVERFASPQEFQRQYKPAFKRHQNLVLSGGSTMKLIVQVLDQNYSHQLFLTDERIVPHNDSASNYGQLLNTGTRFKSFSWVTSGGELLHKDEIETKLRHIKEEKFDLLLGVGDDGHIASLFDPVKANDLSVSKDYKTVQKNEDNYKRFSLKNDFLSQAEHIELFILGNHKAWLLEKLEGNDLPIQRFLNTCRSLNKQPKIYYIND